MGQVSITLNDRTYRLVCDDGEEDHLADLARMVKAKIETLRADVGHVGDERLMLMAALLIADDLVEARSVAARQPHTEMESFHPSPVSETTAVEAEPGQKLRAAAAQMADGMRSQDDAGRNRAAGHGAGGAGKTRRKDVA
jgi:cell division protein ZapA